MFPVTEIKRHSLSACLILIAATVFVLCFRAEAAEEQWKLLWQNEKGERFFYDAASVVYLSKDEAQVWIKEASQQPVRKLEELNCVYKIFRDREVVSEGTKIAPRPNLFPHRWQPIEKNQAMKELHKALCK